MNNKTKQVIDDVLKLSPEDRVRILEELLSSLDDGENEVDIDEEWAAEIKRRSKEIETGSVKPLTWPQVKELEIEL